MSTPARRALDGDLAQIASWDAAGLLTRSSISAGLDRIIEASSAAAHDREQTFAKLAGDPSASRLTLDRWAAYLRTAGIVPDSTLGSEAAVIVYQSLAYLSRVPFYTTAAAAKDDDTKTESSGLTCNELHRAVAWALPDRHRAFLEESSQSRMRSTADHRRLIFQSLATSRGGVKVAYDDAAARRLAAENASEGVDPMFEDLVVVNHDDDGDEMFHDVLDVLYSAQPPRPPGMAWVYRDSFRSFARGLHEPGVRLRDLAIPYDRFRVLTKALLLGQLDLDRDGEQSGDGDDGPTSRSEPAELEEAADAVAGAFCQDVDVGVTWVEFDRAVKKIAPHLFDAFYHVVSLATLGKPCPGLPSRCPPPKPAKNSILTPPKHAQLSTFLSGCLDFDELALVHSSDPSTASTQSTPPLPSTSATVGTVLFLVSGLADDGTRHTFGAYRDANVPAQSRSGVFSAVSSEASPDDALLFQLRPRQDVFLGVGAPAWTTAAPAPAEVCFGTHMKGAVMVLRDGARTCVFANNDHGPEGEVFAATRWRGAWGVEFRVDVLEVWRSMGDDGE